MILFPSNPNFSYTESCQLPYTAYEQDVVSVLDSIVLLFRQYFENVDSHPLKVINVFPSDKYPMTVYETATIFLCVSPLDEDGNPGLFWNQFIYQFSHELCHYMNFGHVIQPMRWFEECLCELASHFFLIKGAEQWAVFPPYLNWRNYAPNILSYEISMRSNTSIVVTTELSKTNSRLLASLENDEYQRPQNKYIALELLPLFIRKPALWNIVPYLTALSDYKCFAESLLMLGNWSGEDLTKVLNLFGIAR